MTDELEIEVYTTETDEHPEFSDTIVVNDGMIINLYAPEGVLPKGVTASAERVDSALRIPYGKMPRKLLLKRESRFHQWLLMI